MHRRVVRSKQSQSKMSSKEKLVFEMSTFKDPKQKYTKHVNSHYFNHAVSIIIPEADKIPDQVEELLNIQPHYIVHDLPLVWLISEEFIEAFVKRGSLYMLTDQLAIDTKTCVALLPSGVLVLNVAKDFYQELGLEGHVSKYHSKDRMKYVIHIDLTLPQFRPGKKNFERVKWCLNERLDLKFNFLVTWVSNDVSTCPSSIEMYFKASGLSVSLAELKKVQHKTALCPVPILNSSSFGPACRFSEFYEWLGVVACGCEFASEGDFVSSLTCPEPNTRQKVCHLKMSGFIAPQQIHSIIDYLRSWGQSSSVPWISVTVHGFMDSPVSWNKTEHGFLCSGDNLYTFVLFPNDDYWLYTATGSSDIVS